MIVLLLNSMKRRIAQGHLRHIFVKTGVLQFGRKIYNQRILDRGIHEANVLGRRLRFRVSTAHEIARIDGIGREGNFFARIVASIRPGDVFYDVGANIGIVSLLVADASRGSNVSVHAFEPEPTNEARLRQNIESNGFANIHVHCVGLASRKGTATLFLAGDAGTGAHSMVADVAGGARAVNIELVPMSELAAEYEAPTCIKIDVEGAELEVLYGSGHVIDPRKVHDVFVEVHPQLLEQSKQSAEDVLAFMSKRGFALVWSEQRGKETLQHYRPSG